MTGCFNAEFSFNKGFHKRNYLKFFLLHGDAAFGVSFRGSGGPRPPAREKRARSSVDKWTVKNERATSTTIVMSQ